jgi:hypothetical protein
MLFGLPMRISRVGQGYSGAEIPEKENLGQVLGKPEEKKTGGRTLRSTPHPLQQVLDNNI